MIQMGNLIAKGSLILCLLLFLYNKVNAQCIASGPNNPSNVYEVDIGYRSWSNLTNVYVSDAARATSTSVLGGLRTNYLVTTGYNFSIPLTATICGIHVEMEKSYSGIALGATVTDDRVRIVKGGIIIPTDIDLGGNWPSGDNYFDHGSSTEAWGTDWTPADINASNFGIAISAKMTNGIGVFPAARINNIRISVYYDEPLPIELLKFNAFRNSSSSVKLSWSVAKESDNDLFIIERSLDGVKWEELGQHNGIGNGTTVLDYFFVDENYNEKIVNYYRIKQLDVNGNFEYSQKIILSSTETSLNEVHLYPIPAKNNFTIQSLEPISKVEIVNAYGVVVYNSVFNSKNAEINFGDLKQEVYYVKIFLTNQMMMKKMILE